MVEVSAEGPGSNLKITRQVKRRGMSTVQVFCLPTGTQGGEFLQLGTGFGARIHRMFLNSGGCRLKFQILWEGNGRMSRGVENERMLAGSVFKALSRSMFTTALWVGQYCPDLWNKETEDQRSEATGSTSHSWCRSTVTEATLEPARTFPFAGIQGEPLWSGTVDRKIPWARGVPVVHMPRGGVTQERQSVWEAAGLPWRKDSPRRSLPSIPSVSLSCSLCQIAGTWTWSKLHPKGEPVSLTSRDCCPDVTAGTCCTCCEQFKGAGLWFPGKLQEGWLARRAVVWCQGVGVLFSLSLSSFIHFLGGAKEWCWPLPHPAASRPKASSPFTPIS